MTIKSIADSIRNSYIVTQGYSLNQKINTVYEKSEDARQEYDAAAMTITAGAAFGLFGKSVMILAGASFSLPGLVLFTLIGAAFGTLASCPTMHSFFTNLEARSK